MYFQSSVGVSFSRYLGEEVERHIKPLVSGVSEYVQHPQRESGAAPNPACRRIAGDLLDIHTCSTCMSTKHRQF